MLLPIVILDKVRMTPTGQRITLENGIKETLVNNPDGIRNIITFERYRSGYLAWIMPYRKISLFRLCINMVLGVTHYNPIIIILYCGTDENNHTETRLTRDIRTHVRDSEHLMAGVYRTMWKSKMDCRFQLQGFSNPQSYGSTESTGFVLNNHFQDHMNFYSLPYKWMDQFCQWSSYIECRL